MRDEAPHVRDCRKDIPSRRRYRAYYKHEGRRIYAQGTFATKADASSWLAVTETDLGRGELGRPSAGPGVLPALRRHLDEAHRPGPQHPGQVRGLKFGCTSSLRSAWSSSAGWQERPP